MQFSQEDFCKKSKTVFSKDSDSDALRISSLHYDKSSKIIKGWVPGLFPAIL